MFEIKTVLAATDGTERGMRAVETGAAVARRAGGSFDVVSVADASLPSQPLRAAGEPTDWAGVLEEHLRELAQEQLETVGAGKSTVHTAKGRPASAIVDTVESLGANLLVLGAHHKPALSRFLLGSTSEKVARLAPVPVLISTGTGVHPFERILVAIDTSPHSRTVLDVAAAFGQLDGAAVRALHVFEPVHQVVVPHTVGAIPPPVGVAEAQAMNEARRDESQSQYEDIVNETSNAYSIELEKSFEEGHAGIEIVKKADEWDADLVVMGTHGAGFFDRVMMGSRSLHVLRHSERTTLLVPNDDTN